jgi:hypothetical protein
VRQLVTYTDIFSILGVMAAFVYAMLLPFMFYIHKRYGKIPFWFSLWHFVRRLFDPYRDEFGPHFAHGERGRVEYQIVYGFFLEGLILHKRDEKEITPKLQSLLVNRSKDDPRSQEEALAIRIVSFTQPTTNVPPPPAPKNQDGPGITIGE